MIEFMVDKILKSFLPDWDGRAILRWSDLRLREFSKIWKKGNLGKERGTHKFHRYIDSFWDFCTPFRHFFHSSGSEAIPNWCNFVAPLYQLFIAQYFSYFLITVVVVAFALLLFLSIVTSIPKTRFSETFIQTGQSPQFF